MSTIPVIASADDIPSAIAHAERNPSARWYVARKARSYGQSTRIPDSWGLTAAFGGDWKTGSREKAAKKGEATPEGSFPIKDKEDLRRAIRAIGRAKDKEAAKEHIVKRARALGATDMLPAAWSVTASGAITAASARGAARKVARAVEAAWDAALHPRGRDGRFIEKGGSVDLFSVRGGRTPDLRGTAVGLRSEGGKDIVTVRVDRPGKYKGKRYNEGDTIDVAPTDIAEAPKAKAQIIPSGSENLDLPTTRPAVKGLTQIVPGLYEVDGTTGPDGKPLRIEGVSDGRWAITDSGGRSVPGLTELNIHRRDEAARIARDGGAPRAQGAPGGDLEREREVLGNLRRSRGAGMPPSAEERRQMEKVRALETGEPLAAPARPADTGGSLEQERGILENLRRARSAGMPPNAEERRQMEKVRALEALERQNAPRAQGAPDGGPDEAVEQRAEEAMERAEELLRTDPNAGNDDRLLELMGNIVNTTASESRDEYTTQDRDEAAAELIAHLDEIQAQGVGEAPARAQGAPRTRDVGTVPPDDRVQMQTDVLAPGYEHVDRLEESGAADPTDLRDALGRLEDSLSGGRADEVLTALDRVVREADGVWDEAGDDDEIGMFVERTRDSAKAYRRDFGQVGLIDEGPAPGGAPRAQAAPEAEDPAVAVLEEMVRDAEARGSDASALRAEIERLRGGPGGGTPEPGPAPEPAPVADEREDYWRGVSAGQFRDWPQEVQDQVRADFDRAFDENPGDPIAAIEQIGPSIQAARDRAARDMFGGKEDYWGGFTTGPIVSNLSEADRSEVRAAFDAAWDEQGPTLALERANEKAREITDRRAGETGEGVPVADESDRLGEQEGEQRHQMRLQAIRRDSEGWNADRVRRVIDAMQLAIDEPYGSTEIERERNRRFAQGEMDLLREILAEKEGGGAGPEPGPAPTPEPGPGPTPPSPGGGGGDPEARNRIALMARSANKPGLPIDEAGARAELDRILDSGDSSEDKHRAMARLMTQLKLGGKQRARYREQLDQFLGGGGGDSRVIEANEVAENLRPDNPLKERLLEKTEGGGDVGVGGQDVRGDRIRELQRFAGANPEAGEDDPELGGFVRKLRRAIEFERAGNAAEADDWLRQATEERDRLLRNREREGGIGPGGGGGGGAMVDELGDVQITAPNGAKRYLRIQPGRHGAVADALEGKSVERIEITDLGDTIDINQRTERGVPSHSEIPKDQVQEVIRVLREVAPAGDGGGGTAPTPEPAPPTPAPVRKTKVGGRTLGVRPAPPRDLSSIGSRYRAKGDPEEILDEDGNTIGYVLRGNTMAPMMNGRIQTGRAIESTGYLVFDKNWSPLTQGNAEPTKAAAMQKLSDRSAPTPTPGPGPTPTGGRERSEPDIAAIKNLLRQYADSRRRASAATGLSHQSARRSMEEHAEALRRDHGIEISRIPNPSVYSDRKLRAGEYDVRTPGGGTAPTPGPTPPTPTGGGTAGRPIDFDRRTALRLGEATDFGYDNGVWYEIRPSMTELGKHVLIRGDGREVLEFDSREDARRAAGYRPRTEITPPTPAPEPPAPVPVPGRPGSRAIRGFPDHESNHPTLDSPNDVQPGDRVLDRGNGSTDGHWEYLPGVVESVEGDNVRIRYDDGRTGEHEYWHVSRDSGNRPTPSPTPEPPAAVRMIPGTNIPVSPVSSERAMGMLTDTQRRQIAKRFGSATSSPHRGNDTRRYNAILRYLEAYANLQGPSRGGANANMWLSRATGAAQEMERLGVTAQTIRLQAARMVNSGKA